MSIGDADTISLPGPDGAWYRHTMATPTQWTTPQRPLTSRKVYSAVHVVPRAGADNTPGAPADLDWDVTLGVRHHIWRHGLGVADAMDTAQRGMGLDWPATRELIRRSAAEAAALVADPPPALRGLGIADLLACGAGTDQLASGDLGSEGLAVVRDAYLEQLDVVQESGAKVIIMCSRALAAVAGSAGDYLALYGELLERVERPVILHWLGTAFDPALAGYWGSTDIAVATDTFVELLTEHAGKVNGVKVSLLDAGHEVALRRRLPAGVRLYTGDDFNYPELIDGDGRHHSDALLGIFAAIAPAASAALQHYDAGDAAGARRILDSTVELGRHIFSTPTFHYKTGIALVAWLNGLQPGFQMVGGMQSARSLPHLARTFALADEAGLIGDPDLAAERMNLLLRTGGLA